MREMASRRICFTFVKIHQDNCNLMEKVMKDNYNQSGLTMNVTDLANASKTETQQQVSEKFIKAASFIISANIEGETRAKGGKVSASHKKKIAQKKQALWDTKKFETEQWFSQTTYL